MKPRSNSAFLRRSAARPEPLRILGIDPSLTSTGYAYKENGKLVSGRITTGDLRGPHRLVYIRNCLSKLFVVFTPQLIVMEDYAMGAGGRMNNNVFNIGELGGILKAHFWEAGIDYLSIPPKVMKSVIALNGSAEKKDISVALKVRYGITVNQHDEADAVGLMLLGEMRTGARKIDPVEGKSDRFQAVRQAPLTKSRLQSISNTR